MSCLLYFKTKINLVNLVTDLQKIKLMASAKEGEHEEFRIFLKQQDSAQIDVTVHKLNEEITPQIDCTQCGNCCKSLIINVTPQETESLAAHFETSVTAIKEKYIEISQQGQMIINTIPCHFLQGTSCSIYTNRFTECREFPHLHKNNFTARLFGTLMYYTLCPIIFNVVETLKEKLNFKYTQATDYGINIACNK